MPAASPNWIPHYDELRARLESFRYIFPSGGQGETYCSLFDEFLAQREFGLALDVLCDFLLEPDVPPLTENEFRQIAAVHTLMQLQDSTLLRLRDKIENLRKSRETL